MNSFIEIHEFFVEGNNQDRSHVLLHITEPGTPEEEKKGYFFAVAEINNGNLEQIEHLQQMIDDLESGYYETDDKPEKSAFETTLEFINRRGHHILQYENAVTNCLVGVLRGPDLSFAYHGNPQAVLFYQGKEELEQMELIEKNNEETPTESLFSSVMQGNISDGDYFYISSPHVNDYFTADRVKKIIVGRSTRQASEHLQKVLSDLNNELSFGGIIFHIPTKSQFPKTGKLPKILTATGSEESLNKMLEQEKTTKEILSPSLFNKVGQGVSNYLAEKKEKKQQVEQEKLVMEKLAPENEHRVVNYANTNINQKGRIETNYRLSEEPKDSLMNIVLIAIGRGLVQGAIGIFNFLKKAGMLIGRGILGVFLLTTNLHNKRQDVIYEYKRKLAEKRGRLEDMPLISKIIFLIMIILVFVFLASLLVFKIKENQQAEALAYKNQLQLINDKKTAADASLLYGDDAKALQLLQEAQKTLDALPQKNKEQIAEATDLKNNLAASLQKLQKINFVAPQLLADLSTLTPAPTTQKLAVLDNSLIAYGAEDKNLYKIDLTTQKIQSIDHSVFPRLLFADTPKENDRVVFAIGNNSLGVFNKDNTFTRPDIVFPVDNVILSAFAVYSQKLYSVDSNNNQIYKNNPTQTGFDKGQDWLKDGGVDVKDVV